MVENVEVDVAKASTKAGYADLRIDQRTLERLLGKKLGAELLEESSSGTSRLWIETLEVSGFGTTRNLVIEIREHRISVQAASSKEAEAALRWILSNVASALNREDQVKEFTVFFDSVIKAQWSENTTGLVARGLLNTVEGHRKDFRFVGVDPTMILCPRVDLLLIPDMTKISMPDALARDSAGIAQARLSIRVDTLSDHYTNVVTLSAGVSDEELVKISEELEEVLAESRS